MIGCTPYRRCTWVVVLILLLSSAPARSEDKPSVAFHGESRDAPLRIEQMRKHLDDKKWSEAIEELQSILTSSGNELVALWPRRDVPIRLAVLEERDAAGKSNLTSMHSVPARRLCQLHLASLPAEALRLYRQRYETQAQKKLRQAQADRDVPQLRKLVEDAFGTRAAEKAIDLLGDLAFERGRFDEAEEWWRLLAPLPDARRDAVLRGLQLVYPDPSLEPARLQAKQLLARLFSGSSANAAGEPAALDTEWRAELDAYRDRYAKAEGTLAGRKGRYVDLLLALAQQRKKEGDTPRGDWPTFAGDPSRGRVVSAPEDMLDRLSALCREGPTWRFNLEERSRQQDSVAAPAVNAAQARTLAFFPVLIGNQLLVADARHVTAYDLRDGTSHQLCDAVKDAKNGGVEPNLKLPAPPDLRYTLTVADNNVYVRWGAQDIGVEAPAQPPRLGQAPKPRRDNETFLACLSLWPNRLDEHFRWQIGGMDPVRDHFFFEGAPLAADGLIWIATTRYRGEVCVTGIDCYTTDEGSAPPLRWRREVCATPLPNAGQPRCRHQLLTRAGTQIVYCTHNGAVVAVDALTGRTNWAIRYPRRKGAANDRELRDLAPVLFAAGRLYVAPADAECLLCLDPATGRTLWELESLAVVHLLGVAQGRLMFTTPAGLRAVNADNGDTLWLFPQDGALTPGGRGLLIGDLLLFPTTQARNPSSPADTVVYVVRQQDGRAADDPAQLPRLPGGNLLYANGCLVVADRQTLSVFVPPELRRGQHKSELPRSEQQQRLIEQARRAARDGREADAETAFRRAVALSLSPRGRLHVMLRAAQIWQDARQSTRARAVWESIRGDETLRAIQVIDRKGKPASAADSAAEAIARLGGEQPTRRAPPVRPRVEERSLDGQSLPLFRTWHAHLGRDEWILAGWQTSDPELLLTGSSDGRFTCRLTATGDIRWQHRLPFGPRWAGCHADLLLVAGDDGIAGLQRDNGELLWHFPAPAPGRYPRAAVDEVRVRVDPRTPEPLTTFRLAAGRLFCLQGQRRLFAIQADSGGVLWDRWAPDGELRLPFPRGCFSTCYHASAETVLIQMAGRRWLLDAATGRQIHAAADGRDLWQRPPLQIDERTLAVTPDCRQIVLLDARTGQSLWTHRPAGITTLSGEIPLLMGRGEVLLCIQPDNIGYFLQRLDRVSGKPVWPRPRLLAMKTLDPRSWAFDAETVYTIEDESLTARALADGRELWRRPLANAVRQVRRVGDYLMVHPSFSAAEARLRFRLPMASVQCEISSLLAQETICPLSCHDPKTGELVQRLNFRLASPPRTTPAKRTIVEESGRFWNFRTSSLLASEEGAVIRLASPQPLVALGGEVWGLTDKTEPRP
jgi:outer membrane protein assembly factor BamB